MLPCKAHEQGSTYNIYELTAIKQAKEDSRRARRQSRRTQRSMLRSWQCVDLHEDWLHGRKEVSTNTILCL
jgi:hypothetical protein